MLNLFKQFLQLESDNSFEKDIDLVNIVEVKRNGQKVAAIVNELGKKKQFVFCWVAQPIHETGLSLAHHDALVAGLREISKHESITIVSASIAEDPETNARFDKLIAETNNEDHQFFLAGSKARINSLIDSGQRKAKRLYIFATYTVDPKAIDSEDHIDVVLAKFFSLFEKNVSKADLYDSESIQDLLNSVFDVWQERHLLLSEKMRINVIPMNRLELWEYMRYAINGETYKFDIPHYLLLEDDQLITPYHHEESAKKKGYKQVIQTYDKLHMSSLLVPQENVPIADRHFVYLPGRKAYVGVVRFDEVPDGWVDQFDQIKWLWDTVMSQQNVIDIEIVTQYSWIDEGAVRFSTDRYTQQQESMSNTGFEQGRRDRIAEYRSEEAGEAQLSMIKGDRVIGVAIVINVFSYVDMELCKRDEKRAHKLAYDNLRGKINYIRSKFSMPTVASHEQDHPWRSWLQTLPFKAENLCSRPQEYRRKMNSSSAVGFGQFVGVSSRSKRGPELISEKGGCPINVDLLDRGGNPRHGAFFGLTGSGKSTLVALFILYELLAGANVTIMDYPKAKYSSTYTWLVKFLGGAEYDTGATSNNLLEYIDLRKIPDEDRLLRVRQFEKNIINILLSLVLDETEMSTYSTSDIRSLLSLGVTYFYRHPQIIERIEAARSGGISSPAWQEWPTLFDFFELFTIENLGLSEFGPEIQKAYEYIRFRLRVWLDSALADAIAQPSSFDGSSPLKLFALRNLNSNEEAAILGLSAQTAAMRAAFSSKRSVFYCDEVSVLFRFKNLAVVVADLMSAGRSAGLSVLLATQDPNALTKAGPELEAQILQNLSFRLIGKINNSALKHFETMFRIPEKMLERNADEEFGQNLRGLYTQWLVDDDSRLTHCRYYPPANILGIVANNTPEVEARQFFEMSYPNKYEALSRFSKFLFDTSRRGEFITPKHVQQLYGLEDLEIALKV